MGWHSASAGLDVVLVLIILTIFIIICRLMLVFDWRNLKKHISHSLLGFCHFSDIYFVLKSFWFIQLLFGFVLVCLFSWNKLQFFVCVLSLFDKNHIIIMIIISSEAMPLNESVFVR